MDPNHLPSSPLQHHRPSSSRTSNGSPPDCSPAESNKLNLPTSFQQDASSTVASPVATTFPPWQSQRGQEPEPAPSYLDGSWSTRAASASPSQWADEARNRSIASSSRCPTPQSTSLLDISSEPSPSPRSASSLLTSEPLNRSASTVAPSFPSPLPSSGTTRPKRTRSASLPPGSPQLKRFKSCHVLTTPSTAWAWALRPPQDGRSRQERGDKVATSPHRGSTSERSTPNDTQILVASRLPPINTASLRSLDANEILKNPQLRHDLLFDALAFRPVHTMSLPAATNGEVVSSSKSPVVDPGTSCAVADMYWKSIADEISGGCRCTRWRVIGAEGKIDHTVLDTKQREPVCVCGGWRLDMSEKQWWRWQGQKWTSRLPELVRTLREILISLMGSTTPCANHFAHSYCREALEAHEVTCPTVTHALVPELYNALDPEFLTVQVRRRVFGMRIFQTLGEAMKVHCAPVRDAMVDDMVQTAMSGQVALGLRKCFDCVEVMKLDIANHQVHALRPYLWKAAVSHEMAAFRACLASAKIQLDESFSKRWIRDASQRVLMGIHPRDRVDLLACRSELVYRSLAEGFVDLVFANWATLSDEVWPPVIQRRLTGPACIQLGGTSLGSVIIPESFKMDSRRIKNFNAEVVDLAITHMIVLAFQGLYVGAHPNASKIQVKECLAVARSDVEQVLDTDGSFRNTMPTDDVSDLALRLATRVVRPLHGHDETTPCVLSRSDLTRVHHMARTLDMMFAAHVQRDSPMYLAAVQQVRHVLTLLLTNILLSTRVRSLSPYRGEMDDTTDENEDMADIEMYEGYSSSPLSSLSSSSLSNGSTSPPTPSSIRARHLAELVRSTEEEDMLMDKYAMGSIRGEMRDLAGRMSKITTFNLKVFEETYAEAGFVVGRA